MKKVVNYFLAAVVIGLVGYKSVYFKKLSDVKRTGNEKFDAPAVAKRLWNEEMPAKIDSAIELPVLIKAIAGNKDEALKKYSNAMSIGNYRYAIIKTQATVVSVNEDDVALMLSLGDSTIPAVLATEYIYGNAIRDASALVAVEDFTNSEDLNNLSEEMNKIIRKDVVPPFKRSVKKDDKITVVAAIELNEEHIRWPGLELIPLQLKKIQ